MSKLLAFYSGQEATDPRDVFFSLFGLVQEHSENPEEGQWCQNMMDYSLDYRTLLLRVASYLATSYQQHDSRATHILEFFQPGCPRKDVSLPTWVPEWPIPKISTHHLGPLPDEEWIGSLPFGVRVQEESLFLNVKIVDEVKFVSELCHISDKKGMIMEMDIYDKCMKYHKSSPYRTKQEHSRAFWHTTIMKKGWFFPDVSFGLGAEGREADWVSHCQAKYEEVWSTGGKNLKYRPSVRFALELFHELAGTSIDERFMWYTVSAAMWIMVEFSLDEIPPKAELEKALAGELLLRMD